MAKIRIKTDFIVRWGILTRGEAISLDGRDLRLEMNTPAHTSVEMPFSIDGNVLVIRVAPEVQTQVGVHSFTLWENHAKAGQTPLDKCSAFCLVSKSCKADMEDGNIEVEPVLELDTDDMSFAPISVGGGAIEIDAELSLESENAVQNKVVTEAINGVAQKAETAQDTATANKNALANLMGNGSGSIAYQIAQAIASIVANAPEAFDTLKEIADYIASDKTGAADLNNRISANATAISEETTRATTEEKNIRALAEANKQAIDILAGIEQQIAGKADTTSLAAVATSGSYNDLSDKPTIPTVPTKVSEFENDAKYITEQTAQQTYQPKGDYALKSELTDNVAYSMENHTEAALEIAPNVMHVWGEVTALTVTLGAEVEGRANEYLFQFTSGATATTLTLPSDLVWANGEALAPEANKVYQVSIVNGYAVYAAFEYLPTNRLTITNNGASYTVTSEYPVTSDISIVLAYTDTSGVARTENATLSNGESELSYIVNNNVSGAITIKSIEPTADASYKYIF